MKKILSVKSFFRNDHGNPIAAIIVNLNFFSYKLPFCESQLALPLRTVYFFSSASLSSCSLLTETELIAKDHVDVLDEYLFISCRRTSPSTWRVSARYSAWYFFFKTKYPWTGRLL